MGILRLPQTSDFWCEQREKKIRIKTGILNISFDLGSDDEQKVIALLSFVEFERGQLERR